MAEHPELREWPQTRVEWRIEHFTDLSMEAGFYLTSPPFLLSDTKWYIRIYPNGQGINNSKEWVSLYLRKEESSKEHHVEYTIGIKNFDGTVLKALKARQVFKIGPSGKGFSEFIKRFAVSLVNDVALDDSLTIFCTVAIVDESLILSTKEVASQTISPPPKTTEVLEAASQTVFSGVSTLIENFKDLYLNGEHADVTIIVKGREFLAHRNILAARSVVFASMFKHSMVEKNSGRIEILDCNPDTFEDFLIFLYTGKIEIVSSSNAVTLYESADKYDVKELKEECVQCMIRDISVERFCDILHLAIQHNEPNLMNASTEFFIENAKCIIPTMEWENFSAQNNSLANELFLKLLNRK